MIRVKEGENELSSNICLPKMQSCSEMDELGYMLVS